MCGQGGTVYLDCSAVGGECGFAQSARGSNSGTSSTDSPGDSIMQCHLGPVGMLFAVPLAGMVKNIFLLMVEFLVTPSGNMRQFLSETSSTLKQNPLDDQKTTTMTWKEAEKNASMQTDSEEKNFLKEGGIIMKPALEKVVR